MRDIGKNIRTLRIRRNMTQDSLAEKLFVTRQTVSNYETGKSRPDIDMLIRIAEVLDTDVQEIIYGAPIPSVQSAKRKRLFIGLAIVLALLILAAVLEFCSKEMSAYIISTRMILCVWIYPSIYLTAGWCLLQLISLFTKLSPLTGTYVPYIRTGLLLLLAGLFLFLLPFLCYLLWTSAEYWLAHLQQLTDYSHQSFFPTTQLHLMLIRLLDNYPAIMSLVGIGLWLFGFPKEK